MFPRTALVIAALFIAALVGFFVRGAFIAQSAECHGGCQRNIAVPYQMLFDHMRLLADGGRTEDLHALVVRAQEHAGDVSTVCWEPQKDVYAAEVYEWTRKDLTSR
jgi:hypothetical protein